MRITAQNWLRITPVIVALLGAACGANMETGTENASLTLDAGTELRVAPLESLSPVTEEPGDEFTATLAAPLMKGEEVVAPQGATVVGEVVDVETAGPGEEASFLSLELKELLVVGGQSISIETEPVRYAAPVGYQTPEQGQDESAAPVVPEETVLTFRLARPVDVPVAADQGGLPPIS
jgi:hypothetical protein